MGRLFPIANWAGASSLLTGLAAYWTLDEVSGSRADSVGGNTLTDNNTVTQNPGKVGSAAQFTAANTEYLSIADNASLSTGNVDYTLACWFWLTTTSGERPLVAKYNADAGPREYELYVGGTTLGWGVYNSSNGACGSRTIAGITTGTWHHVTAWHDKTNNQVGLALNNGTPQLIARSGVPADTVADFKLGARNVTPSFFWDGRIDEVGFWKRVLTAGERTALYNGGAGVTYPF